MSTTGGSPSTTSATTHSDAASEAPTGNGVRYDRYGFAEGEKDVSSATPQDKRKKKKEIETETRREMKWIKMFDDWDTFVEKKPKKVLERLRKGLPDRVRAKAWQKMLRLGDMLAEDPMKFRELAGEKSAVDEEIDRDIRRTFPSNLIIKQGEQALFRVLRAYANYDQEVGYCQGMGFISGLFLIYMTEEEAFWLLTKLLNSQSIYNFRGMCLTGMPGVFMYLSIYDILLEKHAPRAHKHLNKVGLESSMYCPQWFITAYTHNFPFDLVVRIWDVFLFEGNAILFQVAIALMKSIQDELVTLNFEKCMIYLKDIPKKYLDPEYILPVAYDLHITPEVVAELEAQTRK